MKLRPSSTVQIVSNDFAASTHSQIEVLFHVEQIRNSPDGDRAI